MPTRYMPPQRGRCAELIADAAGNSQSASARAEALAHRSCHPLWRRRLRQDPANSVRWSPPVEAAVASMSRDTEAAIRRLAAADPTCPQPDLRRLASDPDPDVSATAAANPSCPTALTAAFAARARPAATRRHAAANTSCPPWVLAGLTADPDVRVRAAAAGNTNATAGSLAQLTADSDWGVLALLAGNPSASADTLRGISSATEGGDITEQLAANPACPFDLLESLAFTRCMHTDPCDNDSCRWGSEDRPLVLARVIAHPASAQGGGWLRGYIEETLAANSADIEAQIASVAAETSPEHLSEWAGHEDEYVRRELARNPHADAATLATLVGDTGDDVYSYLLANPACPPEILISAAQDETYFPNLLHNPKCPPDALAVIARSANTGARAVAAAHPNISADAAQALAADADRSVRAALAANAACPWEMSVSLYASDASAEMGDALARRARHRSPATS